MFSGSGRPVLLVHKMSWQVSMAASGLVQMFVLSGSA